jgi:hypothetical protein
LLLSDFQLKGTMPTTTSNTSTSANLGSSGSGGSVLGNNNFVGGVLGDAYGTKYGIPNPVSTAGSAISGNLSNMYGISNLTTAADTAGAQGVQSEYMSNLPDYMGMLTTATNNASQELSGQVPSDVISELQTAAAERGVSGGQGPNSPNTNAAYLRALGLDSLGMQQQGMKDFNTLYQDTPTGPQFNPSSMMVTPEQQQAAQLAANQEAAAADPQMEGIMSNLSF